MFGKKLGIKNVVVDVLVQGRKVTVSGPRGTLKRDFGHALVDITYIPKKHEITVDVWFGSKQDKSCIRSVCTHIQNMFTGVTKVPIQALYFLQQHHHLYTWEFNNKIYILGGK